MPAFERISGAVYKMSPADKKIVAEWLRRQCYRLERLPHYPKIKDRVEKLRKAAEDLEREALC